MMKIYNDEHNFIIPDTNILVVHFREYEEIVLKYLHTYFNLRRKTICRIIDSNKQDVKNDNTIFINVSEVNVLSELSFKSKSTINEEMSNIILNNPEAFKTINSIRDYMHDLKTDSGIYKIRKILSKGLSKTVDVDIQVFNINLIMQMLSIDLDGYSLQEIKMIYLNLILFLSKDKKIIMYFDEDLEDRMIKWINELDNNVQVIINNRKLTNYQFNYNFLILSPCDFIETMNKDKKQIDLLNYLYHPLIMNNYHYQNEEKLDFLAYFLDESSSFYLILNS